MKHATPAYGWTRIILSIGFFFTAVVVLGVGPLTAVCFGCDYPEVFGLPSNVVLAALAVGLAVFGLVWMLRIFRGPRDEPPAWRHRDH